MSNSLTAITLGAGLGFLLCIAGNTASSHLAKSTCAARTDTHQVVFISSFLGDTYVCAEKRYL